MLLLDPDFEKAVLISGAICPRGGREEGREGWERKLTPASHRRRRQTTPKQGEGGEPDWEVLMERINPQPRKYDIYPGFFIFYKKAEIKH